jgi:divalent metal cation (Fe/Co/Zn/Cd) transporter
MILLEADPTAVEPGWTALIVVLFLAAAMVFLYLSMRKQFRKIRTPDDVEDQATDSTSERQPDAPG